MITYIDFRDREINARDCQELDSDKQLFITARQWVQLSAHIPLQDHRRFAIMVPDFLHYARLASSGQAREILKIPKTFNHFLQIALHEMPLTPKGLSLAKGEFWESAMALLRFDLGLISGFEGQIFLHPNLSDFAWFFEKHSFIRDFAILCAKKPWGIATNQLPKAASYLSSWGTFPSALITNWDGNMQNFALLSILQNDGFKSTMVIADLTQWSKRAISHWVKQIDNNNIKNVGLLIPAPSPL